MQRRQLLSHALATAGLATLPSWAQAATAAAPLKIGFVYPGPVADVGWTCQHDLGRRMVEQTFGKQVETVFVESVPEGPNSERVIRQLAMDGCGMVVTTSFGFMDPTLRVAKDFPNVAFEHCSGYKTAANVGTYQTRFYEGAFLQGVIAGRMTKNNVLGYVAPFPIPEVIRNLNAFVLGARSVNPKVTCKVVWINSWYDPSREREAGTTLMNQGADTFYQNTSSPAIVQMAESRGLYAFGQDSDMGHYGPNAHLTANTLNWGVYYVHKVRQKLAGQWKPEATIWGMKEDIVKLAPLNKRLPAEVVAEVREKQAAIAAGTLHPFTGPIKDQAGQLQLADGVVMAEKDLWVLKWFAEGIIGKP